ncbi:unnamed protein product, partial [Polarella glacialis]
MQWSKPKAPKSAADKAPSVLPVTAAEEPDGFFALLLNTATKDEGEDFLDYSFPSESKGLQAILPMKGVLLASCGIMMSAVGQAVNFFVFRSLDGRQEFKVSMRRVERWVLCIVLPASSSDTASKFFVEEAAAMAGLKHGSLEELRGGFRQLEPIFCSLSRLWRSCRDRESALLYTSLGVVRWSSKSKDLQQVIQSKVSNWEKAWKATVQGVPRLCPTPLGFALLLEQRLVATSLDDSAFESCLRLCVLE